MKRQIALIAAAMLSASLWASTPAQRVQRGVFHAPQPETCGSCHLSHGQREAAAHLTVLVEEELCLQCHGGGPSDPRFIRPALDIGREVEKLSSHRVEPTPSEHSAGEGPDSIDSPLPETAAGQARHSECVDCHDPHARPIGPTDRALLGVWGITATGSRRDPAMFEYEICFKCHGDSLNRLQPTTYPRPRRQSSAFSGEAFNTRREFQPTNSSFHPVIAPRTSPGTRSLRPYIVTPSGASMFDRPLGPNEKILCTDCHNNDNGRNLGDGRTGPAGPHGSSTGPLLERSYRLEPSPSTPGGTTFFTFDPSSWALCDKCHDVEGKLLSDLSFRTHSEHVKGVFASLPMAAPRPTSCGTCHSAHGVFGLTTSQLIDFDTRIVAPNGLGILRFNGSTCSLSCHGTSHTDRPK